MKPTARSQKKKSSLNSGKEKEKKCRCPGEMGKRAAGVAEAICPNHAKRGRELGESGVSWGGFQVATPSDRERRGQKGTVDWRDPGYEN